MPHAARGAHPTPHRRCKRGARGDGSREAAHVQRMLSEKVVETSMVIARATWPTRRGVSLGDDALGHRRGVWSVLATAADCLGPPVKSFWARERRSIASSQKEGTVVLAAAGWMMFALLVAAAVTEREWARLREKWTPAVDFLGRVAPLPTGPTIYAKISDCSVPPISRGSSQKPLDERNQATLALLAPRR